MAATEAYERDRFDEALRSLKRLDQLEPDVPVVIELLGLTYYRLDRFDVALRMLRKYVKITDDLSQAPVLMDCARALGDDIEVERWWRQLRDASPSKEIVTEGRLVYASFLADQGRIPEAIPLLERALSREVATSKLPAIRQRYLLAQLYERSGNIAGARQLYTQLIKEDATLYDVAERLAGLA
ncbi:MAG: tetratricopeptide repeat protein [Ferrimicrobium sp.]